MTLVVVLTLHRLAKGMSILQQEQYALGVLGEAGAGNGISALELFGQGSAALQNVCDAPGHLAVSFSAKLEVPR